MKRKYQELLAVSIILFIYLGIFINPKLIIESGISSINIFKTKLFPSIFPFFVLASLLLNLGLAGTISRKINFIIKRIFHIEGISSYIIVISIISGFPSGSKYISDCYKKGLINKEVSNYLLTFTHFGNPLFILGTCGTVLNNISIAYKILIINIVAVVVIIGLGAILPGIRRREVEYGVAFDKAQWIWMGILIIGSIILDVWLGSTKIPARITMIIVEAILALILTWLVGRRKPQGAAK